MSDLILNARFMMRPATGVDRVAGELMCALDGLGLPIGLQNWRALRPSGTVAQPETRAPQITARMQPSASRLEGHMWEQLILGQTHPNDWLMSLCNIGPVMRRKQIVMMHDAQVFRQPESYSRAFRLWYHTMQPRLGKRAAMVLTVSHHAKAELEHFGVVPKSKARVVPNGADHILRKPAVDTVLQRQGLAPGGYFLAIGSLAPHKNIELLTQAARARQDTSLPLVIAGGSDRSVFVDAGLVPTEDVRPIGRVSDGELRALYQNAKALLFPSLTEGFGLPPLEAMLCGCPVIASTGGAIPEVCGNAAVYVDPLDVEGWTAAMTRIAHDDYLRYNLIKAGHINAAAFTWANAAAILSKELSRLPDL